jgi:hypothetical protein
MTIVDPSIWDVPMLNRLMTESRVYATSSMDGLWLSFPPEQKFLIRWAIVTIERAVLAKYRRGIEEGMI